MENKQAEELVEEFNNILEFKRKRNYTREYLIRQNLRLLRKIRTEHYLLINLVNLNLNSKFRNFWVILH